VDSVVDGVLVVVSVVVVALPWHLSGFVSRSFRLLAPSSRACLTSEFTLEGRFWTSAIRSSVLSAATRQLPTSTFAWISSIFAVRTAASWAGTDGSGPPLPPQPTAPAEAAARIRASSIGRRTFGIAAILARGLMGTRACGWPRSALRPL
jgi:hypothetical protein